MSCGGKGEVFLPLLGVRNFIRNASEEKMLEICKLGKYNGQETWYLSLGAIEDHVDSYDMHLWINQILYQRLG